MGGYCGDCGVIFGSGKAVCCGCFLCERPEAVVFLEGGFPVLVQILLLDIHILSSKGLTIERSWERADK